MLKSNLLIKIIFCVVFCVSCAGLKNKFKKPQTKKLRIYQICLDSSKKCHVMKNYSHGKIKVDSNIFIETMVDTAEYGGSKGHFYINLNFSKTEQAMILNFINKRVKQVIVVSVEGNVMTSPYIQEKLEEAKIKVTLGNQINEEEKAREICLKLDEKCTLIKKRKIKNIKGLFGKLNKYTIAQNKEKNLDLLESYVWYEVPLENEIDNILPVSYLQIWNKKNKKFISKGDKIYLKSGAGAYWGERKNYVPLALLMERKRIPNILRILYSWKKCPKIYQRAIPKGGKKMSINEREKQIRSTEMAVLSLFGKRELRKIKSKGINCK